MKNCKNSFLFLCLGIINFGMLFTYNLSAQKQQDSTLYYYESIVKVKDVKTTTKAIGYFEKKATAVLSKDNSIKAASYYELMALGQFKLGALYESELTSIKALTVLDASASKTKTKEIKERLFNHLGMLYRHIEDYDNALKYYIRALKLNSHLLDKVSIVTNIANVYADQDQYEKAVNYLLPYYDDVVKLDASAAKATYLANLGFIQSKLNNPKGLKRMELALDIRKQIKDLTGLFGSYHHFSFYYFEQGNRVEALKYLSKLKTISDTLNSKSYELEVLKLALQFEQNPRYNEFVQLNNSIIKEKQKQENKYAAIQYDVAQKERQIIETNLRLKTSALENEKEKRVKFIYLSLVVLGMLSSIFAYFYLRSKNRKEKLLQVYKTETRISKKVHDEVANDIYHVMSKLQHEKVNEHAVLDDLEHIYSKTRDISKESRSIDFSDDFKEVLKDLLISYDSEEVSVITKGLNDINWLTVTDLKKTAIYRVLQELMTNMKKHSNASITVVAFQKSKSKINLRYSDNGIGSSLKKQNGLQNAENRIKSLKGTINFESNKNEGFKVEITV